MGNQESNTQIFGNLIAQEWEELSPRSFLNQKPEEGQFHQICNKITGQIIQEHQLTFIDQQDYINYQNCFKWRLKQPYIVNTKYFCHQKISEICSNRYISKVYIQNIPTRLSDITDIPFPQNLYVLQCCVKGFQKLYESIGYLKVEENLICVDQRGQVKVWMNANLSKNYPDSAELFDSTIGSLETNMVSQIIQIVKESTDRQTEPQTTFQQFLEKHNKTQPTFKEAKILIHQYASLFKIKIPQIFQSMLQIMNEQHKVESSMNQIQSNIKDIPHITINEHHQNKHQHFQQPLNSREEVIPTTHLYQPSQPMIFIKHPHHLSTANPQPINYSGAHYSSMVYRPTLFSNSSDRSVGSSSSSFYPPRTIMPKVTFSYANNQTPIKQEYVEDEEDNYNKMITQLQTPQLKITAPQHISQAQQRIIQQSSRMQQSIHKLHQKYGALENGIKEVSNSGKDIQEEYCQDSRLEEYINDQYQQEKRKRVPLTKLQLEQLNLDPQIIEDLNKYFF